MTPNPAFERPAGPQLFLPSVCGGGPLNLSVRAHPPMSRRRIRKRSSTARVAGEASALANRLSWKGAALLGVALFAAFYWLLPAWLRGTLEAVQTSTLRPVVEHVVGRRIYWSQLLGTALALLLHLLRRAQLFLASSARTSRPAWGRPAQSHTCSHPWMNHMRSNRAFNRTRRSAQFCFGERRWRRAG